MSDRVKGPVVSNAFFPLLILMIICLPDVLLLNRVNSSLSGVCGKMVSCFSFLV